MLTASERQTAADALGAAERDRRPIAPLTELFPGIGTEDAYEIQLLGIGRRVARRGSRARSQGRSLLARHAAHGGRRRTRLRPPPGRHAVVG